MRAKEEMMQGNVAGMWQTGKRAKKEKLQTNPSSCTSSSFSLVLLVLVMFVVDTSNNASIDDQKECRQCGK